LKKLVPVAAYPLAFKTKITFPFTNQNGANHFYNFFKHPYHVLLILFKQPFTVTFANYY